ncbi:hypothetical protein DUI87_12610 [Hirundo rustica rustica]|uniref:Galactosyltransferase C-terminal domain-containing protein n=1 Tax=Hirundo rustica rustica TaxID=333673 RepID=A0A3M0KUX5_HIRRU|nr:hypothetical protein DUI87_12610 [Hirundo rustica rustica]
MIGCSFVVNRKFFGEIGLLDPGMDVYGGENIELGIKGGGVPIPEGFNRGDVALGDMVLLALVAFAVLGARLSSKISEKLSNLKNFMILDIDPPDGPLALSPPFQKPSEEIW